MDEDEELSSLEESFEELPFVESSFSTIEYDENCKFSDDEYDSKSISENQFDLQSARNMNNMSNNDDEHEIEEDFEIDANELNNPINNKSDDDLSDPYDDSGTEFSYSTEDTNSTTSESSEEVVSKKRKAMPAKWLRNKNKKKCNTGKKFVTTSGTTIPARVRGKGCTTKCHRKYLSKFTDHERKAIFKRFWKLSHKEKWEFIIKY